MAPMKYGSLLIPLVVAALLVSVPARGTLAQTLYFDDSDPSTIIVGNSYYEIGFRKSNGAIAFLTDKATGQHVSEGSRYGCLWGAFGGSAGYVGGCSFNATNSDRFGYAWSAATNSLSLTYTSSSARTYGLVALVTVAVSDSRWFDLRLRLQSHWGATLDYVSFPSELVFREATLQKVLFPSLPGVVLAPAFFEQNRSTIAAYPGELFADFTAIVSSAGNIAISSLPSEPISPLYLGFNHDDSYLSDSTYYYHTFGARLSDGGTWSSPTIRVRVGQSPVEAITGYRADHQLDASEPLTTKLGNRYTQVVQSPLYKADATQLAIPFSQYPRLLAGVPVPGIIHPLAFQERGFDENYPDLLPPASSWGTTADMAAMFRQAQAMHFLVMPYTNPTWWDDASPTLQHLPMTTTLTDVAVLDTKNTPRLEWYGSHDGYVVSPYAPFVQQRLARLLSAMTTTLPSDLVFEDQVGSRSWLFDSNTFSPSPTAYPQGWLDHTRVYSKTLLMTEGGFDRLAETTVGFHGSVLLAQVLGEADQRWGSGTWYPYPLAPMMLRDRVLFYQHDLAPETFTTNKATLSWNLAFGYMLSYDLGSTNFGGGTADPWLAVVGDFQRSVISRYAGDALVDYRQLQSTVTQSVFTHAIVTTNWSADTPYAMAGNTLPAHGAMITLDDGSLVAGVFTRYNGLPLSTGEHYLIEERRAEDIIVRQPLGASTSLTVERLPGWQPGDPIIGLAIDRAGDVVGSGAAAATVGSVTFVYQNVVSGIPIASYRILRGHRSFLPVVRRSS